MKWDYENSLLQVSGSIYRYYGIDRGHGSDMETDRFLERARPRCIVALLIDAMGTEVLAYHLPEDSFFRRHLVKTVTTVYPTATTAATTAFLTGRSPAENGWFGWNQYFAEEDDNVILFMNRSQYGGKTYPPGWSEKKLPVEKIFDVLPAQGVRCDSLWPGWAPHNPCASFDELLDTALSLSRENQFLYVYWDQLDSFMHRNGMSSEKTREMLEDLDEKTAAFAAKLPEDTVLLVIADHGMCDVRGRDITGDEELCSFFRHEPALEPRCCAFYIKEGMEQKFETAFNERFKDDYILLKKEEIIREGWFGENMPHQYEQYLGDCIAIAVSDAEIRYRRANIMRGDHAGITEKERRIPVILYAKEKHE